MIVSSHALRSFLLLTPIVFILSGCSSDPTTDLAQYVEQVKTQLARDPKSLRVMRLDPTVKSVFDYRFEHFELQGYEPHKRIPAPIAV